MTRGHHVSRSKKLNLSINLKWRVWIFGGPFQQELRRFNAEIQDLYIPGGRASPTPLAVDWISCHFCFR